MPKGADTIREQVAEMLREEYFGEEDRDHAAALLAAAEYGREPERIAEVTGLDLEFVGPALDNLAASDFWKFDESAGAVRPQLALVGGTMGAVNFGVWLLIAQGRLFTQGDGDDSGPVIVDPNAFFDANERIDDER